MIRLFVGLGNPGPEYSQTRHNAGFWWIDRVSEQWKAPLPYDKPFKALYAKVQLKDHTLWLLEPQMFMNLSGQSVSALAHFFKIKPEEILVVHDELDVTPGQAKLKLGGSHAGHNGLRDIHAQLGSDQYWRLRLGIGHPGVKSEVIHWVLKKPSIEQRLAIDECLDRSLGAFEDLIAGDMSKATLKIHTSKPPRPKPVRPLDPMTQEAGSSAPKTATSAATTTALTPAPSTAPKNANTS
jgi:PTH1 family peptidyl-tRNA hydrolase